MLVKLKSNERLFIDKDLFILKSVFCDSGDQFFLLAVNAVIEFTVKTGSRAPA